jgi:hypothetical protein
MSLFGGNWARNNEAPTKDASATNIGAALKEPDEKLKNKEKEQKMNIDNGVRQIPLEERLKIHEIGKATVEQHYSIQLTKKEYEVLLKLINKELEVEKETSIESLVEHAKKLKKFALEMYPKDEGNLDVYVDEDEKRVNFEYKSGDPYWNRMRETQVLLKFFSSENKKEDKVSRRIYV